MVYYITMRHCYINIKYRGLLNIVFLFFATLLLSSCGAVISEALVKESNLSISPSMVRENPEAHISKKVVWGGVVISTENKEEGSIVEVFATTLTKSLRPTGSYNSTRPGKLGRFLIKTNDYLDPLVFKINTMITVAGEVEGVETKKIGEMDYKYPVIKPTEIKLFAESDEDLDSYPYTYAPYNPYYRPYYPYYYPW